MEWLREKKVAASGTLGWEVRKRGNWRSVAFFFSLLVLFDM